MDGKIILVQAPTSWRAKLLVDGREVKRSTATDRKGQAHQQIIDYCLANQLPHLEFPIEEVKWEGC